VTLELVLFVLVVAIILYYLDEEEPKDEFLVQTVGWVIRETPKWVSVASELLPNDEGHRAVTHIPAVLVEKRLPLAFVEPA
jgi:hypothetical protein